MKAFGMPTGHAATPPAPAGVRSKTMSLHHVLGDHVVQAVVTAAMSSVASPAKVTFTSATSSTGNSAPFSPMSRSAEPG
jgi:hypothetical protein